MTPRVISAYKKLGFSIDLGSPGRLYSVMIDDEKKRTVNCSGGFTVSDTFIFTNISKVILPENILVIGNSFGMSTCVLADLFPNSKIDAIDAECENIESHKGSEVTRRIAISDFNNIQLTIGFSPQDLPKVAKGKKYDFIFVDAMHTNDAVIADYFGIQEMIADNCVVYFHDVVNCGMLESWNKIREHALKLGFSAYNFGFTQMGCTAIVRGFSSLQDYFTNIQNDFNGPYKNGYTDENIIEKQSRPFFWDLSFSQIEQIILRKIRRIGKY
jgi:hypothetical protein